MGAAILILWAAVKDASTAKRENLYTIDGTVVEQRSTETAGGSRVRLGTGGTARIQGERKLHTALRIRKSDGTIANFSADEWFPTPKTGWEGQPIRVQHDARGNLYEIAVAGEVVRDVETTLKYRKIDNKKKEPLMVFLIVIGVPLTIVGYLLHFFTRPRPTQPPPLP